MTNKLKISGITTPSFCDGPGVRCTIFFSGCTHHCKGCHNPNTWDFNYGYSAYDSEPLHKVQNALNQPYIDGLTLSGGDPMDSAEEVLQWLRIFSFRAGQNIVLYTGYTMQQIKQSAIMLELARRVDILITGPYIEELRITTNGLYGSTNQEIWESKGGFRRLNEDDLK